MSLHALTDRELDGMISHVRRTLPYTPPDRTDDLLAALERYEAERAERDHARQSAEAFG